MAEKTRDQLIRDLTHYRDLRHKVTDDKLQAALDELIRLTKDALDQAPKP